MTARVVAARPAAPAEKLSDSAALARQTAQVTAEAKAWLSTVGPRLDSVRNGYSSKLDSIQRVTDSAIADPRERAHVDSMFAVARWKNDSVVSAKTNAKKAKGH